MARRERFVRRRKALGLTQEDLAALLKVERSTVRRWESGETEPHPWLRPRLAKTLRVSPDRLAELLDDGEPPGRLASAAVPRQLPPAVADFTGRAAEVAVLDRILNTAADGSGPGTVVISAIGGTAGVGKTALALYWAHRAADRFHDGQLYVNLRGFDASGTPVTPDQAVRRFLDALGVPPSRIPVDPEEQTGMYRSLLASRRMLIVLDNARDEEHVRPLLPASPGSLVVVTSRNSLAGLAATGGARLLSLNVLTHDEAVLLLTTRIGADRASAEPASVAEIASLCACLPLALAVAAASAAARPGFPLSAVSAELRDAAGRLDALDTGDRATSVRAVFSWSYEQLSANAARMFRLLGLAPGPDISVPAAASLAGTGTPQAHRLLAELTRDCLVTEHAPGRYACHDLLRAYAANQARSTDSDAERTAAIGRILDHYLHTASHGTGVLVPSREQVPLLPPALGSIPVRLADPRSVLAWFDAEHLVLSSAAILAAESGFDRHAWQLPWATTSYLQARGSYREWAAMQRAALAAATRLGDIAGQAIAGRGLARALVHLGDYDQARALFEDCVERYQLLGNRPGEARTRQNLGHLANRQSRPADALRHMEQAYRLFQTIGDSAGQAVVLNDISWCHGLLGDFEQARIVCRQGLSLSIDTGLRRLEGDTWDTLGYAEHHLGNFGEAAACYERALGIIREFGERASEAEILAHLGDTWHAAGELLRAGQTWRDSLAIFEDLGLSRADEVRAKLTGL